MMLSGALLFLPAASLAAQFPVENPRTVCTSRYEKDKAKVGQFVFRTYEVKASGKACLQVFHDDKVIFRRTNDNDGWFRLGQRADKGDGVPAIPNGTDITGRGYPDMIVSTYSGGAHCCLSHFVFELESKFRLLATLQAEDSWPAYFAANDEGNHYYYFARDWTFSYWPGSFAGSPNHSVVLEYRSDDRGGGFHLAVDKMKRPVPTPREWQSGLDAVQNELALEQKGYANSLPNVLWQEVMDLIYTGHSDLAWKFLDEVGPQAQQGNYPDLADFCSRLKTSPYWADLELTLRDVPPACTNAEPDKSK